MTSIKIQLQQSIIDKIKGKNIAGWNINNNGELELEFVDCDLEKEVKELQNELDAGKGVRVDINDLEKHFGL
ncbi:hypothetical protein [Methanobrevibacter curvatus]|uniref:Uncharacterized protein n=1 Tax=Methanobrevibacter curvatus TaxID=49547 RepID=A0A162FA92_9EURY|nr:hypothetical protein [Methanobrevibacter curvatus]KZX10155.1 hypothetical protein MBCUR_18900 [Methanobrevibacter curvatus]